MNQLPLMKRIKNRRAQGMAEFALVLPLLLFVIFGIIAFGHLFFNYTLVVASAREAARYGIATGLSETNLPRFRDCNAIRDAAVRVGSYAGVDRNAVDISYDKGPVANGTPSVIGTCPIGEVGPGNIEIGDRISITVSVTYTPIIDLGFIPKIPLTATTQRTLIQSMPIADQAVSEGETGCSNTITRILPPGWDPNNPVDSSTSNVGDLVTFSVQVLDDTPLNADYAVGKIFLFVDDPNYTPGNHRCTKDMDGTKGIWACDPIKFDASGTYHLYAEFQPSASSTICYKASKTIVPWEHTVP